MIQRGSLTTPCNQYACCTCETVCEFSNRMIKMVNVRINTWIKAWIFCRIGPNHCCVCHNKFPSCYGKWLYLTAPFWCRKMRCDIRLEFPEINSPRKWLISHYNIVAIGWLLEMTRYDKYFSRNSICILNGPSATLPVLLLGSAKPPALGLWWFGFWKRKAAIISHADWIC